MAKFNVKDCFSSPMPELSEENFTGDPKSRKATLPGWKELANVENAEMFVSDSEFDLENIPRNRRVLACRPPQALLIDRWYYGFISEKAEIERDRSGRDTYNIEAVKLLQAINKDEGIRPKDNTSIDGLVTFLWATAKGFNESVVYEMEENTKMG